MSFKATFFICIFSLCSLALLNGQESTIRFNGLKKTQESFLEQFIQSKYYNSPTDSILLEDVQRLKNIAGIGNATYVKDTINNKVNITFNIEEVKTLLPIVNFGSVKDNVWFQLGFSDIHWRGKGELLSATYQNYDQRHGGSLYYKVPRLNGSNWGYDLSLNKWSSREPLYFPEGTVNYDYDNNSFGGSIIKHFDFRRNIQVGITYFVEKYKKSEIQFLEKTPGPDDFKQPKYLSKIDYKENYVNYHYFYVKGWQWQVLLQDVYNTIDENWFHSIQLRTRFYDRIGDEGNLAVRARFALSTNNNTPFAPFVVDSHVNIRGVGNRIDRGTGQLVLNIEYRHTIHDEKKWAGQLVAFSDFGSWRRPGGELKDLIDSDEFRHFVGGGFRIIYQKIYGAILRVDYAVNVYDYKQSGFVIGFGQYY